MKGSLTMSAYMAQALLTAGEQRTLGTAGSNPLGSFLTLLGSIVLLVLILFLAFKCTQLISRKYAGPNATGGELEIVGRTVIGPEQTLVAVRLPGRVLLLGVTPHHISALAELDPVAYESLPPAKTGGEGFGALFKDTLGKNTNSIFSDKAGKKE